MHGDVCHVKVDVAGPRFKKQINGCRKTAQTKGMKMNIFKKLPQAMVRVIATGALLVATALGSVVIGAGVASAAAVTSATSSVLSLCWKGIVLILNAFFCMQV